MPKGRKSIKTIIEENGFDPEQVFNKLKGSKTLDDASALFNKATQNKVPCSPQTIVLILKKDGATPEDYPFLQTNGKRGKESAKERIIRHGFIFNDILEALKKAETTEQAAEIIEKITNGKVSITPITVTNMLKREEYIDLVEYPFLQANKRGKASTKDLIEKHFGKSLWDTIREICTKGSCSEVVAAKLQNASKIKVTEPTLIRTVSIGIDNKEITEEDWFFHWVKPKRIKKDSSGKPTNLKGYALKYTCRECQYSFIEGVEDEGCFGSYFSMILVARRCNKCNKWGSYVVETTVEDTPVKKAVVKFIRNGEELEGECFVDNEFNKIDNPLPIETQDMLTKCKRDMGTRQDKERKARERASSIKHREATT